MLGKQVYTCEYKFLFFFLLYLISTTPEEHEMHEFIPYTGSEDNVNTVQLSEMYMPDHTIINQKVDEEKHAFSSIEYPFFLIFISHRLQRRHFHIDITFPCIER